MFPTVARDRREGCLTSTGDGFKKKNRSIHVCQVASVRQEMHMQKNGTVLVLSSYST